MKLKDLYSFFIEQGIKQDPRGQEFVSQSLKEVKESYEKLSNDEKKDFDIEKLTNPYTDSRVLNGSLETDIKSIMAGIDIETPEILLADNLRSKGRNIDLILTHHPAGKAYATFYEVIEMQSEILSKYGVPINIAESLTNARLKEVGRSVKSQNHHRAVDAAKLLGYPFLSAHTVADNHVATYLQNLFNDKNPKYIDDIVKILKEIPEYKMAALNGAGPFVLAGTNKSRAGKIFVDMTGGTEGSKDVLEKLADSGVGTIVGMHMSENHYKNAEKFHIRVVIAGHISSDNLGLNLLFDEVESKFGALDFIECSGFNRIRHKSDL